MVKRTLSQFANVWITRAFESFLYIFQFLQWTVWLKEHSAYKIQHRAPPIVTVWKVQCVWKQTYMGMLEKQRFSIFVFFFFFLNPVHTWSFEKYLFPHVNAQNAVKLTRFCKWTQAQTRRLLQKLIVCLFTVVSPGEGSGAPG